MFNFLKKKKNKKKILSPTHCIVYNERGAFIILYLLILQSCVRENKCKK